jgi:hypothetical protein
MAGMAANQLGRTKISFFLTQKRRPLAGGLQNARDELRMNSQCALSVSSHDFPYPVFSGFSRV